MLVPLRSFVSALFRRWHIWLTGLGLVMLAVAGLLLGLSLTGVIGGPEEPGLVEFGRSDASTSTGFSVREGVSLTPGQPTGAARPTPEPPRSPIAALVIDRIGVEAPVVTLGVDADGVMESPNGPEDVAWYRFTSRPGTGGNAVFSGHVDYHDYGPAVFWDLRDLRAGDTVEVRLEDGTVYSYKVVSAASYEADEAPVAEIVGPTARESVTLITCGGTFDREARQYSHRLVVRAERA